MVDVQDLFEQFVAEDRAGGAADPLTFLAQVDGAERATLEALLDAYLARASRRPFDAAAFAASPARAVADRLTLEVAGSAGTWPTLLPELRERARVKRSDLVRRLADALGVGAQAGAVGDYYHRMELGSLPAGGVSDRVLRALGDIVGVSWERLREAGSATAPDAGSAPGAAFARVAPSNADYTSLEQASPARPDTTGEPDAERERVDALFTGGPGAGA